MENARDFRKSDEQLITAEIAKRLKVKNGKLVFEGRQLNITLPGKPGKRGYTPQKGKDYFDGKDGKTPKKGVDYFDGEDGKTPVKGRDYFDGKDGKTPVKGIDYRDGENGYTPVKGKDYFDGEDGKTPVKGVDYCDGENGVSPLPPDHQWDGTKVRFQKPDGSWGRWVNLRGQKPKDGKTPVKGVDYNDGEDGKDAILPKSLTVSVLADAEIIDGKLQKKFQQILIYPLG